MKPLEMSAVVTAAVLFMSIPSASAKHGVAHQVLERRHAHHHQQHQHHRKSHVSQPEDGGLAGREVMQKRGKCQFPSDAGLVAVAPGSQNAGWAMSPDQPCNPNMFCPYACPPGELMAQWDPSATSYSYPQSMNGGLHCDSDGGISKPFPDKPYCYSGKGSVVAVNNAGGNVAFCQTVLPGNEAMLIPTNVISSATLAVPGTEYWAGTAAHYYINPPGVSPEDACIWGSSANPVGNWSPYVAGANTDANGNTFVKLGWNPIYLEQATPFRNVMPTWGVKIECDGGGCNGLPCAIDPSQNHVNECVGSSTSGAGGGAFCVVTVPQGSKANIVVYGQGGSSGNSGKSSPNPPPPPSSPSPSSSSPPPPPPPSPSPSTSSYYSSTTTISSTSSSSTKKPSQPSFTYGPHVFVENSTISSATGTAIKPSSTVAYTSGVAQPSSTSDATTSFHRGGISILASVVVMIAVALLTTC